MRNRISLLSAWLAMLAGLAGCGSGTLNVVTLPSSVLNPGVVYLSSSTYSAAQGAGSIVVTITRGGGTDGTRTVDYATTSGTAVAGIDFTATSGTLTWSAGDGSARQVAIPISDTAPFSGSRSFGFVLSSPTGDGSVSTPATATLTIFGNAAAAGTAGAFAFSAASYSVGQAAGTVSLTVHRGGGAAGAVTVDYATASGTASAGAQFTTTGGTLVWADGDATDRSVTVPVSNATPFSGTKSFSVTLTNATGGASLGSPASATVTIAGSGGVAKPGTLAFAASAYAVGQAAGTATITVNRTGGTSGAVGVQYATADGTAIAGSNYTSASGTLSWPDGDATAKTFTVAVSNVAPFSGTKNFSVVLSAATGGATLGAPASTTVTIGGSGGAATAGSLALSAATYTVGQAAGSAAIAVNRNGGSMGAVTVKYLTGDASAKAGTDYTAQSGTLQWADGDVTAKTFNVPVSNATPFAGTKSLSVTLSTPTGGATLGSPASAPVVIDGSGAVGTTGIFWVYTNGVFAWPGDYSFVSTIDYKDTSGAPLSPPYDIKWTVTGAWGGFQPYATNWSFDTTPYTYLRFAMKPTVAGQKAIVYFMLVGDKPVGVSVNVLDYGPAPVVGQWAVYTIPLSDIGVANTNIYKFAIQDQTGLSSNVVYLDDIGFVPAGY